MSRVRATWMTVSASCWLPGLRVMPWTNDPPIFRYASGSWCKRSSAANCSDSRRTPTRTPVRAAISHSACTLWK
ncbi:Uncharacterised protein [Bordetella pertussis]|nr:Uncharacterised protein [Bordetella pertussis]CFO29515.1 Uncharacterised protein [Bordetella pertussis]CFP08930.1 Uncharacterised protein [Bordetella pertussis]CFU07136.1 Uncharacterised protein [Bordetella pertussis]CFW14238.1 Uncharacterised protein [Bordetella pertussis]